MTSTTITQNSDLFQANSQYVLPQHPGNFNTIEIEQEIIGGLLLDPNAIGRIYDDLDPKYFTVYFYQDIINCIKDLHRQGKIPDLTTVTLELKQRNRITDGSEQVAIATIAAQTVCAVNIDQHLQTLIENYNRSDYFDNGKLKPSAAINRIKEIYNSDRSQEQIQLDLLDLQEETGMSDRKWYEFSRTAIRESKKIRYKLDLTSLSGITNELDRSIKISEIAEIYRKSRKIIEADIRSLESSVIESVKDEGDLFDFLDSEAGIIDWIYPGLLPKGELLLLASQPKVGKTLFATDIMYAHLTGTPLHGNPIPKGRVLYYYTDEPGKRSVQRRLCNRGFDLLESLRGDMRLRQHLQLNNLEALEEQLKTFRPTLVVIDSLTAIASDIGISENDVEFAKYVYKLGALLNKYGAAGILIHHENKSESHQGIDKVSGSSRITAAVWGIAQMKTLAKKDDDSVDNETTPRLLKLTPREGAPQNLMFELLPRDLWSEQSIFKFIGSEDDKNNEKQNQSSQILKFLNANKGVGFAVQELKEKLGAGNYIYEVLNKLEDQSQIIRRRDKINKRRYIYLIPDNTKSDLCATNPPPAQTKPETEIPETEIPENKIQQDIQTFRLDSDLIQMGETSLEQDLKQVNIDKSKDSGDNKELIQVSGLDLDTPPSPHIDATTQEDVAQNPDRQNTSNNVNGQEDNNANFKVGDRVIELESDEEFVIVEVIKNSPYPDGQYIIENERKLPEKIRGFALEKID